MENLDRSLGLTDDVRIFSGIFLQPYIIWEFHQSQQRMQMTGE